MSVISSRPAFRWLVPVAAAVTVIGGGAAVGTFAAQADPSLPERSAAQLLVDLQTARLGGMSGTVVQRADLGLPQLPAIGGQAGLGLASLLSGSNTLRVWYNGPEQARVALVSTLGETDLIRNGEDAWLWESTGNTAQHFRLSEKSGAPDLSGYPLVGPSPTALPSTPQEVAALALSAIEPTTEVTTGGSARVAGRDAYELVLAPKDKSSLVGQVRLAIDATEHLPLRVEVFPVKADEPAFEVAFTQISFDRPDPERFTFNPPPGAKVEEKSADETRAEADKLTKDAHDAADETARTGTTVVGEGWTGVLVARISDGAAETKPGAGESGSAEAEQGLAILDQLRAVRGTWGSGKLLTGKLFSALLTDDGRLLVGAVSPERLYEVAGSPTAKIK